MARRPARCYRYCVGHAVVFCASNHANPLTEEQGILFGPPFTLAPFQALQTVLTHCAALPKVPVRYPHRSAHLLLRRQVVLSILY